MPRRLHTWKIRNRELALGERTLIMGVLNVTPDSFSDGGKYLDPDHAYARAMEMEEQGADIIDIGAESTKPGVQPIPAAEELRRLVPVLKRLREQLSIPISIDTYKAETAERALELGAEIINDPSGFTFDPQLAKPIVQYDAGVIFNHMRGRPETWASLGPLPDVMGSVVKDLDASVSRARRAGVDRARIVVDPGIGFGKRREQNSELIARLGEMTRLEVPLLVGPSRKSFLAQPGEQETRFATAAAVTASILNGAHIIRVHDVAEMKVVAAIADDILRAMLRRGEEIQEVAQAQAPPRRSRPVSLAVPEVESVAHPPVRPPLVPRIDVKPAAPAPDAARVEPDRARTDRDRPLFDRNRPAAGGPDRSGQDRPRFDRAGSDRAGSDRPRSGDDRPRSDRAGSDRPRSGDDRPRSDRAGSDRPRSGDDRPPQRRPLFDRRERDLGKPSRPRFDRDRAAKAGPGNARPPQDRPRNDGPSFDRNRPSANGDRPRFDRNRPSANGDRPRFDRNRPSPNGGRPPANQAGQDRERPRFNADRPRTGDERPRPTGDRPRPPFNKDRPRTPSGNDRPRRSGPPRGGFRPNKPRRDR